MLAAGVRVVAHVGHVADVHGEQGELAGHRDPAQPGRDRGGITPLDGAAGLGAHPAADLDLGGWCWAGHDAVQQDARVASEIERLRGAAHH
jgi:hypothetical protein